MPYISGKGEQFNGLVQAVLFKNIYESESFYDFRALFGNNKKENDGYREFARFLINKTKTNWILK
jgi:hypothetical protein